LLRDRLPVRTTGGPRDLPAEGWNDGPVVEVGELAGTWIVTISFELGEGQREQVLAALRDLFRDRGVEMSAINLAKAPMYEPYDHDRPGEGP
jgi:hypothetical protein